MSWNYRVIKQNDYYAVHEVYYDKDGNPEAHTRLPCVPNGESKLDIELDLRFMILALYKPVLIWDEVTKKYKEGK